MLLRARADYVVRMFDLLECVGESDASTCCVAKQTASVYGESSSEAQSFLQATKAVRGFGADADVAAWIGEGMVVGAEPFLP